MTGGELDEAGQMVDVRETPPSVPLDWRFSQVFGERSAGEEVQDGAYYYSRCFISPIFVIDLVIVVDLGIGK